MLTSSRSAPLTLIDVGASGGPPPRWQGLANKAEIIGFEPDRRAAESMKPRPGFRYLNVALYSHVGRVRLYFTRKQECSSVFPPNRTFLDGFPESDRFDVVGSEEVDVDTLDRQLVDAGIEDPDFLKLDVQGAELAVLQGGLATLEQRLVGVQAEVCFVPLYEGQPLFSDVDIFLKKFGFELFDLSCEFWKRGPAPMAGSARGQLIFADAVYLKSAEATLAMLAQLPERDRAAKLLKAVTVAGLYGYQDHGVHLLEACRGFLDAASYALAFRTFSSQVPLQRRIPDFPGRRKAAGLAYQAYRLLRPRYWADYPTRYNRG
jgi:FkbM family methyltransferase